MMKLCKYSIEDIIIIYEDGTTDTIPQDNIIYMYIEKDYFKNFLPIFNIKCMITDDLYIKLNKNNPKYKVQVNKFYLNNDGTAFDKNNSTIVQQKFINDIFININKVDLSPSMMKNLYDRNDINMKDDRTELEKANKEFDLYLFKEDSISYRKLNNKIFQNTDLISTIIALSQLTDQNKLLISYLDNTDVYDNIIIPQNLTFIGIIKYLQSIYGLYNTSYFLFDDFDTMYLLNKDTKCTALKKGELQRVYINYEDILDPKGNRYGFERQVPYKAYRIYCIDSPQITNINNQSNELLYDDLVYMDTNNGNETKVEITGEKNIGIRNTKIVDNKYGNEFVINSFIYENKLNQTTIMSSFNELDIDILTPNKEYYIDIKLDNYDYSKIKGLVKLSRMMTVFQKTDDSIFTANTKCEFKRP